MALIAFVRLRYSVIPPNRRSALRGRNLQKTIAATAHRTAATEKNQHGPGDVHELDGDEQKQ
jgi:hypothetical protein